MIIDSEALLQHIKYNPTRAAATVEYHYSALTDWLLAGTMPEDKDVQLFHFWLKALSFGRRFGVSNTLGEVKRAK